MGRVIRLMVSVMMAATSTTAFAGAKDEVPAGHDGQPLTLTKTEAKATSERDDLGSARGEPTRPVAGAAEDARAAEERAIEEYNREQFLNQIWTSE